MLSVVSLCIILWHKLMFSSLWGGFILFLNIRLSGEISFVISHFIIIKLNFLIADEKLSPRNLCYHCQVHGFQNSCLCPYSRLDNGLYDCQWYVWGNIAV